MMPRLVILLFLFVVSCQPPITTGTVEQHSLVPAHEETYSCGCVLRSDPMDLTSICLVENTCTRWIPAAHYLLLRGTTDKEEERTEWVRIDETLWTETKDGDYVYLDGGRWTVGESSP